MHFIRFPRVQIFLKCSDEVMSLGFILGLEDCYVSVNGKPAPSVPIPPEFPVDHDFRDNFEDFLDIEPRFRRDFRISPHLESFCEVSSFLPDHFAFFEEIHLCTHHDDREGRGDCPNDLQPVAEVVQGRQGRLSYRNRPSFAPWQ